MVSRNMAAYRRLHDQADFENDLNGDRSHQAMLAAFTDDFEIVEPASLPHGGSYKGLEEWARMSAKMKSIWDQSVKPTRVLDVPEHDLIVLCTDMEWTAKATGKTVRFPAVELLHFRDGQICRVEIFPSDTKAILDTLEAD